MTSKQRRTTHGPFEPEVNAGLEACFGPGIASLDADFGNSFNAEIAAEASTVGGAMSFGPNIGQDPANAFHMEVIGHEVAHALASGGSGETVLDEAGDPGEARADSAGRAFAEFMASGGPPPALEPAWGGRATIHRFESSEHKDSVDHAADRVLLNGYLDGTLSDAQRQELEQRLNSDQDLSRELNALRDAPDRASGHAVDPQVVDMMTQEITLANGVTVTAGDITAMMGDFYGVFDEDGNFDAAATFEQMNQADPDEMRALIDAIEREANGDPIESSEWEEITRARRNDQRDFNGDGIPDNLTYLDLAARNDSHFSGRGMTDENTNMGSYTALHELALQAAESGDIDRARALEASAMHYLTDRHAAGHAFVKQGVMDASGERSDLMQNLYVKGVHDYYNEHGMEFTNADGESWRAYGDGHWGEAGNASNRSRTAESVYSSWSELNDVAQGNRTASEVEQDGYRAHQTVVQYDQSTQDAAEERARNMDGLEAIENVSEETGLIIDKIKWGAEDAWEGATDTVGESWDTGTGWLGDRWDDAVDLWDQATDWIVDRAEDIGEAWSDGTEWVGDHVRQGWDTSTEWLGDRAEDVGDAWSASTEWVGDRAEDVAETWADGTEWVGGRVSEGWDASTEWVGDRADDLGEAWSASTEWVGDEAESAWSATTDWVGSWFD